MAMETLDMQWEFWCARTVVAVTKGCFEREERRKKRISLSKGLGCVFWTLFVHMAKVIYCVPSEETAPDAKTS